jgi:hypothetical protein
MSDPSNVIVSTKDFRQSWISGVSVHHRNFPEVQGEGNSHEDAAARLVSLLTQTLQSAPSVWRREMIERAIEDVGAFAEQETSKFATPLPSAHGGNAES